MHTTRRLQSSANTEALPQPAQDMGRRVSRAILWAAAIALGLGIYGTASAQSTATAPFNVTIDVAASTGNCSVAWNGGDQTLDLTYNFVDTATSTIVANITCTGIVAASPAVSLQGNAGSLATGIAFTEDATGIGYSLSGAAGGGGLLGLVAGTLTQLLSLGQTRTASYTVTATAAGGQSAAGTNCNAGSGCSGTDNHVLVVAY